MALSGDTFSESSTNSDGLTFEEIISANPQHDHLLFYGSLPIFYGQTDVAQVYHLHGSIPTFSSGSTFSTGAQIDHLHGSIPTFASGSTFPTGQAQVNHLHGSLPTFASGSTFPTGQAQVNHLHGSIPTFASGSTFSTGQAQVNHLHGSIPTFAFGSTFPTGINHPRGSMPITPAGSSFRIRNEVAQISPSVARPIVNALYDPNFAMIGLPVDPFLRQFMFNPDFGNKRN